MKNCPRKMVVLLQKITELQRSQLKDEAIHNNEKYINDNDEDFIALESDKENYTFLYPFLVK